MRAWINHHLGRLPRVLSTAKPWLDLRRWTMPRWHRQQIQIHAGYVEVKVQQMSLSSILVNAVAVSSLSTRTVWWNGCHTPRRSIASFAKPPLGLPNSIILRCLELYRLQYSCERQVCILPRTFCYGVDRFWSALFGYSACHGECVIHGECFFGLEMLDGLEMRYWSHRGLLPSIQLHHSQASHRRHQVAC